MEKVLKKYTTIPEHLYINRNADQQLRRIVEEMQRPGYVLVARQMGKTNLLINAKRTLENQNRLFVYVDLSNLYVHERDCYRNIIDCIIEPNENLFEAIELIISDTRQKELPPHKEYSKCLRIVLDHFKGDIVIVLDEIDALKSVEYSDNIFAQIRSNYFSRTNYPEFERLTYLLSGVIEPTELIKDRNKSPFNIGDKIYLDDFTKSEHNEFIEKSRLKVNSEVADEIYNWTHGNPRLTFDICSEVESLALTNETITKDHINLLIKRKYLTTFDIAPIDHIRELVKTNKQVRNAVKSIQKGDTTEISDEIKGKLYLYGIINSKFNDETFIKNRIIELSLSLDWINSIDRLSKDDYSFGLERMETGEFEDAINSLNAFLSNSTPTKSQVEICHYNLGFAHYKLRDLNKSIEFFSKEYTIDLYKTNSKTLLGICKLGIGKIDEGMEILEEVISTVSNDFAYRNAILNLAPLLPKGDNQRALELYDNLFKSTNDSKDDTTESELNQLRTLSLYYQAELLYEDGKVSEALDKIDSALNFSSTSDSVYLIYFKYKIRPNDDLKHYLVDILIEKQVLFDPNNLYPISFNEKHLTHYLNLVFNKDDNSLFQRLLQYSISSLYKNNVSSAELAYKASFGLAEKKVDILNYLLQNEETIDNELLIKVYSDLALQFSTNSSKYILYFNKYLSLFTQIDKVESNDIYLFALCIKFYSDLNKIQDALKLCDIIHNRLSDKNDEDLKFESVIIYYWYSSLYFTLKNRDKAIFYADKTILLIEESQKKNTSMIDEKGLRIISEQMEQIKDSSRAQRTVFKLLKYGRNDRIKVKYKDGRIVEEKYKKLEADIIAERCEVI